MRMGGSGGQRPAGVLELGLRKFCVRLRSHNALLITCSTVCSHLLWYYTNSLSLFLSLSLSLSLLFHHYYHTSTSTVTTTACWPTPTRVDHHQPPVSHFLFSFSFLFFFSLYIRSVNDYHHYHVRRWPPPTRVDHPHHCVR